MRILFLFLLVCVLGCGPQVQINEDQNIGGNPSDPGGIGITYDGKMGTDLGGGLIVPFDGRGIKFGTGL